MLLKRGTSRTRRQRLREAFWPTMGLRRTARYYKQRLGRLPGTPYYIAIGFSIGIAVSFTPFIGFHLMLAGLLAWMCGGSLLSTVLGTVMAGNPWTFPLIWVGTYKLGQLMMGASALNAPHTFDTQFTFSDLMAKSGELLLPMALGSIPCALVSGVLSYYLVRNLVRRQKEARLGRIYKKS